MFARIALFLTLVCGLVGVTAAVGAILPTTDYQTCENYKTC
ncbi:hypothetical protein [Pseudovibrio flavus]|nr:hypothetical protein [Pseudovibrio flavus]